jgi:hypothetical protein
VKFKTNDESFDFRIFYSKTIVTYMLDDYYFFTFLMIKYYTRCLINTLKIVLRHNFDLYIFTIQQYNIRYHDLLSLYSLINYFKIILTTKLHTFYYFNYTLQLYYTEHFLYAVALILSLLLLFSFSTISFNSS